MTAAADTERLEAASAEELLAWGIETFGERIAIAMSFQSEGMVIIDMASRLSRRVRVFTIDTGRLPQETYELMQEVRRRYGIAVEAVFPEAAEVESMVTRHGPNLFYEGAPKRMLCCEVRKVRPLERKLATLDAWVTGVRRGQAETRAQVRKVEIEAAHGGIYKLNPLADWDAAQVAAYTQEHDLPQHALYGRGYTSIGCQPCTRATQPGEDARAGRWWWETDAGKECGIHFSADGKARREVDVLLEEILSAV